MNKTIYTRISTPYILTFLLVITLSLSGFSQITTRESTCFRKENNNTKSLISDTLKTTGYLSFHSVSEGVDSINRWFQFTLHKGTDPGEFFVEFEQMTPALQIEVFNDEGRKLQMIRNLSSTTLINLQDQASGAYIIRVSDEKRSTVRRVIVDRDH